MTVPPVAPESWECTSCHRRNRARATCWNCAAPYAAASASRSSAEPPLPSRLARRVDDARTSPSGEPADEHHLRGMGLWAAGHREEALAVLTEAAEMGSAQAMKDAGDLAGEMGRRDEARSWYERSAGAGHAGAMWSLALLAREAGDQATAATWYERSAKAGMSDGYSALARSALDSGDEVAAQRWAKLGADAGQTFCMVLHAKQLAANPRGGSQALQQARDYLEQAAGRGDVTAAGALVEVNARLGDDARARRYVRMLQDSGNQEEIDRLHRLGYV